MTLSYTRNSKHNKPLSLRKLMELYGYELIDRLCFVHVSTSKPLTMSQDYFMSWSTQKNIEDIWVECNDVEECNNDLSKIYSHKISLAVLQQNDYKWLMNMCSLKQRNELLDVLHVEAVAIYLRSLRMSSYSELQQNMKNHNGENKCLLSVN
uniref:Uncharacterized protein n=1 Tax=Liagoropsis maxima TaxID=1653392 RepID=A0A1G4NVM7_9FLOR|nr:Hypothetical protein ORF_12 [Liagoropsis maxima]SCW22707.1 Hypothetical protein ORF_12 [Liagoropsis maxima]